MAMEMNNNNTNNETNDLNRRVSRGRQKVAMVKMENESNLQVTFSKRRSGLFKKASELCTLCGAQLAIVVFSPGRKVFSFGHPSVELVIDRFLNPHNYRTTPQQANSGTLQLIEAHRNANVRELNQQLSHVTGQMDVERKRSNELKKARKARVSVHWWEAPAEALNDMRHLEELKSAMELLRRVTTKQADRLLIQTTANANSKNFHCCKNEDESMNNDKKKNVGLDCAVAKNNPSDHVNVMRHFNMSPQMQANTSAATFGHFNMSPAVPHLQPKSSAPKVVSHGNVSGAAMEGSNGVQLPMLPQSLPHSSQLLMQQPTSQGTHVMFSNNNSGFGHGFF